MIITRTPFRVSFFGGGTDYPVYYGMYGGAVLSTTINKYCHIICRRLPPFFNHKYLIRWSKKELCNTIDEIQHPSVRACLKFVAIEEGVEMVHTGDIPAMSGIGSSSAFTVGFLNALYALKGKMVTKRKLALDAVHVEQEIIGECVGSQDQAAAAFGGLNKIEFGGNDGIFVQPIVLKRDKLEYLQDCMMFYFTGLSRVASDIAKDQILETPNKLEELASMREMVEEALAILTGPLKSLNDFGRLLHESWMLKRGIIDKISNPEIDEIYEAALKAGALGGKLCGAGGGGFILLFVPPPNQPKVRETLNRLLLVPFRFETLGSHVIHYSGGTT